MEKKSYYQKSNRPFIFLGNIDKSTLEPLSDYILKNNSLSNLRWDGSAPFAGSSWWFFPYCFRFQEYRNIMLETTNESSNYQAYKLACPIFERVEELRPELEIFYSEINLIPPGKKITSHVDNPDGINGNRWYLGVSCRIHVPLYTNEEVTMICGEEELKMPLGSVYEFQNNLMHSVENNSDQPRVHIVMDLIPKEYKTDMDHFMQIENKPYHILNYQKL